MKANPKKVACYLRVSTVEQNEQSQRNEIEKWLAGNSVDPSSVIWLLDKSTGDNTDRPAFKTLQELIFMGDVGTAVLYRLDRLSRKMMEGLNVLTDWCERRVRVVSVTQQIDFNGMLGPMLAAIFLALGQMEQEVRRERQKAGIEVAKKAGRFKGRKPGTTKAKPERALKLRLKGLSIREISKQLKVSRNTVFVYLRKSAKSQPALVAEAVNLS